MILRIISDSWFIAVKEDFEVNVREMNRKIFAINERELEGTNDRWIMVITIRSINSSCRVGQKKHFSSGDVNSN